MTVKQETINKSIWIVKWLMNCSLPITTAKKVYMLHKELNEHYQFVIEEEKKTVASLGGTVVEGNNVKFEENSDECYKKFDDRKKELSKLNVNIVAKPIHISISDIDGVRLRPADIEAAEPFIIFED